MHPWRERLSRWFTPLARVYPFSPNSITLSALAINAGAAVLFYRRWFLFGMVLLVVGGLADALDGIVARVQNKTSRYGDFLDHFADRVSDLLVIAGWMLGAGVRAEVFACGIIAVMLNGYVGTQIEATWHERDYESVGRGEFVLGLVVFPIVSHILLTNGWSDDTYGSLRIAEWMTIALIAFAVLGIVQRLSLASRLEQSR